MLLTALSRTSARSPLLRAVPSTFLPTFRRAPFSSTAARLYANSVVPPTAVSQADMSLKISPRLNQDRGNADHGWLKTFHTFSFASYEDAEHTQFGCLRVINEDCVAPKTGFGTHPHNEFEIFSYIVSGELNHRDSMDNVEILKRGDLQMTSAGTGIRHSEHQHGPEPVHFLQIWSTPHTRRLAPQYFTRHFTDAEKADRWVRVVTPAGAEGVEEVREHDGPAPVHSHLEMRATILSAGKSLQHTLPASKGSRKAYVHLIQASGYNDGPADGASLKVSGQGAEVVLREGDGAYITGEPGAELNFENIGDRNAEVVLFDVDI